MKLLLGALLFLTIASCGTKKVVDYDGANTEITSDYEDSSLDSIISPYTKEMEDKMNEVTGQASVTLEKQDPESPLGNFAADAMYEAALVYAKNSSEIDTSDMKKSLCLLNFGGLRAPILEGDITVGNVFEFMPFDNTLTLVKISAEKAKEMAYYLFEKHGQPVSNAKFQLSSDKQLMWIGGEPYNYDEDIMVVTSDYLANGGDKMSFFKDPIIKWDSGILMRDIYIDYIDANRPLGEYAVEDRITFIK